MTDTSEDFSKEPDLRHPGVHAALERYWRTNVRIMGVLLVMWGFVGLGCGVLFAGWLNQFKIGGYPLGFWFAQQGSILTFVVLVLIYALMLNRLDRQHHEEIERLTGGGDPEKTSGVSGGGGSGEGS